MQTYHQSDPSQSDVLFNTQNINPVIEIYTFEITDTHARDNKLHIDGLVQYCSISSANALEILQSWTKP